MRVDGRRTNLNLGFLPTSWELSCGVGQRCDRSSKPFRCFKRACVMGTCINLNIGG